MERNSVQDEATNARIRPRSLTAADFGMKQLERISARLDNEHFPDKVTIAFMNGECDREG